MNRKSLVFALCWSALFFGGRAVVSAADGPGACVTCHSFLGGELAQPVKEWQSSVHKQNDISCDLCHGGNAEVELGDLNNLTSREFDKRQSEAMSKSFDFIGRPVGKEMFDMCGQCHDDSVARYAASLMGRAYIDGKGGPSCVTCHNAHNNIMPEVPGVCENCHEDTSGYDRIDPMNVTAATIKQLSRIRIELAKKKAQGARPPLTPGFPEDLETYQIGLVAFGAILVLFIIGCFVYSILERRK